MYSMYKGMYDSSEQPEHRVVIFDVVFIQQVIHLLNLFVNKRLKINLG
jgi:hypothetical protein